MSQLDILEQMHIAILPFGSELPTMHVQYWNPHKTKYNFINGCGKQTISGECIYKPSFEFFCYKLSSSRLECMERQIYVHMRKGEIRVSTTCRRASSLFSAPESLIKSCRAVETLFWNDDVRKWTIPSNSSSINFCTAFSKRVGRKGQNTQKTIIKQDIYIWSISTTNWRDQKI